MTIAEEDYVIVECVLKSDVLRERLKGKFRGEVEAEIGHTIDKAFGQIRRDALIGTHGDFTKKLFPEAEEAAFARLVEQSEKAAVVKPEYEAADLDRGELPFRLELQAKWFSDYRVGLQHLIQVLCGDIFGRAFSDIRGSVSVRGVVLGPLGEHFKDHYGKRSYDISAIRKAFALDGAPLRFGSSGATGDLPLLGFNVKPRNGLTPKEFARIATGVLRGGFNIVETDVRNADFKKPEWRAAFHDVAHQALAITTHVARFSLNLTGPADLAITEAKEFFKLHKTTPWVVKVDGGLDGLSTIQALRSAFDEKEQPIITCYPILAEVLANGVGEETFRNMLVLSGADIVYPGKAPRLGAGDFVDYGHAERGYRRYLRILEDKRPMPTIAGGVHAGQLPAYFEMFGPEVAYFIGGGVSLHRNGAFFDNDPSSNSKAAGAAAPKLNKEILPNQAVGGAELCRFAVEAASLGDLAKLSDLLAYTQNNYLEKTEREKEENKTKYQFQPPKNFLVGAIKSFRTRKKP